MLSLVGKACPPLLSGLSPSSEAGLSFVCLLAAKKLTASLGIGGLVVVALTLA